MTYCGSHRLSVDIVIRQLFQPATLRFVLLGRIFVLFDILQIPAPSSNCYVDAPKASGGKDEKAEKPKKLHKRGFSLGAKLGGNSGDR